MKRLLGVLALVFTAILALSGCVNMNAEVNVTGADQATGALQVTTHQENLQGQPFEDVLASQLNTDELDQILGEQWSYTTVDDGENVGLRFETVGKMNFVQLQDAFSTFGFPISLTDKGGEFEFSMPGAGEVVVNEQFTEANLVVSFPGKVVSHSAGEVEHHSVAFDMMAGAEEYKATGSANYALFYSMIFGGALLVLVLIIALAFAPKGAKDPSGH
ncbi:hypothetical protein CQ017_16725 [Arthrobacter sp. MYb224]|uniref:LppM family (lipo)protein n=1 Tax=unclassified Arthrobacter TaxID=235627 RepID=UPI000CFB6EEB|nr:MULTISPECIES: DUF3153 domain-containing protein [unclassified Arthrobacter]PQZ96645.1 hypothetical protein CQ017_16725 [Arthrobacter sp. MYb224]PRA01874.1 hypothetical protein CQ019_14020 [Arthrobacter sp. MYb229]PRB50383.1 hypothetical protein CQ013_10185 [Arthrobacter sp. MYb216]